MELQQLVGPEGELYSPLHDIFDRAMDNLPDTMRSHDLLDQWLFWDEGATRLFIVDHTPAVMVVSAIREGLSAHVLMLNPDEAEAGQIRRELMAIMAAWKLKRLTAEVPGPVKGVQQILKEVGFRREGHLRRAAFLNGRLCGVDIYGLYKERPPRRSNGKAANSPAGRSESSPAEAVAPHTTADSSGGDQPPTP